MAAPIARGSTNLDFGDLTPEDFERICFLILQIEFPDIVPIANPDGGIEFGLPDSSGGFIRCWQTKRFTGHISWSQCRNSLDSAVANYGMPHYTYCFARDLTRAQRREFQNRLVARHPGVRVDYVGHSQLESKLLTTPQGERITNHFYEDRRENTLLLMAALRSGVPLETGADVIERLEAIAAFVAANDPHYRYSTVTHEADAPGPDLTPATIISVAVGDGQTVKRIDAVPRNPAALRRVPEGTLWFDDTPEGRKSAEKFNRFMQHGGTVQIEDARFELRNLPPLIEQVGGEPQGLGTIILRSPQKEMPPWQARFVVDTDRGRAQVDVLLEQCDAPDEWDAALCGSMGGLAVIVSFRTLVRGGQMNIHWSYGYSTEHGIREQAHVLTAVEALQGAGTVAIQDRAGKRPTADFTLEAGGREVDMRWVLLRRFFEALITIEEWTGHQFTLPDEIPGAEIPAAIEAAQIIHAGESEMTIDQIELVMPVSEYEETLEGPGRYAVGYTFGVSLLGDDVWIGELRGELPAVETETNAVTEDGEERVQLLVRPVTHEGRRPTFKLFPPHSGVIGESG